MNNFSFYNNNINLGGGNENKNNIKDLNKSIIKRRNKSKKNNNKNMINILPTRKPKEIIINEQIYPDNLTKKEMQEIFLNISKYTDKELNDFPYKKAIQFDKRTYWEYYLSLIRTNHLLFFSFFKAFDYNSISIKIFLFFFNFALSFFVNALFFNDETMHKIYEEKGSFNFIYNIPQILYSSLISGFINGLIQILALTDSNIIEYKQKSKKKDVKIKKENTLKRIRIKIVLFFILSLILLFIYWIYLASFCAVYKNTQIHLIKDTACSFVTSMIYPFAIYFLPGVFRLTAIKSKKKDKEYMYKFSKLLVLL